RATTLQILLIFVSLSIHVASGQVGSAPIEGAQGTSTLENPASQAEQASDQSDRRVITRIPPIYPRLARSMNLRGNVRIDATVARNGNVKTISVRGGNPVLVEAAEAALYKWKWSPSKQDTREVIEIRFDAH